MMNERINSIVSSVEKMEKNRDVDIKFQKYVEERCRQQEEEHRRQEELRRRRIEHYKVEYEKKFEKQAKENFLALGEELGYFNALKMLLESVNSGDENKVIQFNVDELKEEAKTFIPPYKYKQEFHYNNELKRSVSVRKEYGSQIDDTLEKVASEIDGINGTGLHKNGTISGIQFAKYILRECKGDTTLLKEICSTCVEGNWVDNTCGITETKLQMLYHLFVLHYENLAEVKRIAIDVLKEHDYTSLRVLANGDERYRYRLNIAEKMTMWLEDEVCSKLNLTPQFAREVAA